MHPVRVLTVRGGEGGRREQYPRAIVADRCRFLSDHIGHDNAVRSRLAEGDRLVSVEEKVTGDERDERIVSEDLVEDRFLPGVLPCDLDPVLVGAVSSGHPRRSDQRSGRRKRRIQARFPFQDADKRLSPGRQNITLWRAAREKPVCREPPGHRIFASRDLAVLDPLPAVQAEDV